jgi:TfoX/Sxy family transcriptional regulator of competence genes
MAYDEQLAARVRTVLEPEGPVVEKRMFGGLAMLVAGHMAVCVSGRGGLLVRVGDDAAGDALVAADPEHVAPMVMGGQSSRSWLEVAAPALADDEDLERWVRRGLDVVRRLPPKA